jgi:regulator of protease activity HflC (stomatin/prohibitin superfamily)
MNKSDERSVIFAVLLLAVVLIVDAMVGGISGLSVFSALQPYTATALAVCLLVFLRLRLARQAAEEERDHALERDERADTALFDEEESAPYSIRRTQRQFERFVVPAFTPLLAVVQAWWAWRLWRGFQDAGPAPDPDWMLALSFLVGQAFFLFLFSRYLIGLGRLPSRRLLRGAGILVGLGCIASTAAAAAAAAGHLVHPAADRIVAYGLVFLLGLLAVENLLAVLIGLYSPRRAEVLGTAYQSRIGGLLTDPAGWVKNLAHAIDYQFGFKVSETWFFRLLRATLLPLLAGIGLAVYAMSCFVFIEPHEAAVKERFGRPLDEGWLLESGFHLKLPWPFESVRRAPAGRVLLAHVGHRPDPNQPREELILWTQAHYIAEDPLLVAIADSERIERTGTPVAFVDVSVPIEYRVRDLKQFLYAYEDPEGMMNQLGRRVLIQQLVGNDLGDLLGPGRLALTDRVKAILQQQADAMGLGVEVLFVGLQGIHPPTDVAAAYQAVVAAMEEKEAAILEAEAYAISEIPIAEAEAQRELWQAEAYHTNRVESASAEVDHFRTRLLGARQSPRVYRTEAHLRSVRAALEGTRKYIVDSTGGKEVLIFDFVEKFRPGSLPLGTSAAEGTEP